MRLLLLLSLLFCGAFSAAGQQAVPPPTGYVTDRAGLLSPDTVRLLESFLRDFQRSDSTQIAVLTIPSLEGEPVESYALRVAESWGIGRKGKDNGALLLVSRDDRRVRIEVGYGLEGRLTDLLSGRIIDNEITPRFREGDFDGGIVAGVKAIAEAVRGEYQGTDRREETHPLALLALLLFLGPGLMLLGGGSRRRYPGHHRRGGMWIGGPPLGGGRGGLGGGGFGGFGGGGFGGGGASGRW